VRAGFSRFAAAPVKPDSRLVREAAAGTCRGQRRRAIAAEAPGRSAGRRYFPRYKSGNASGPLGGQAVSPSNSLKIPHRWPSHSRTGKYDAQA